MTFAQLGLAEPLDGEALALFDAVLLATGLHDCIHTARHLRAHGVGGEVGVRRSIDGHLTR